MRASTTIGLCAFVSAMGFLCGCGGSGGGGGNTSTANTGTVMGTLSTMEMIPAPGSTFIPQSAVFRITWPAGETPPPTFSVTLQEFFEPVSDGDDSEGAYVSAQPSTFTREGNSFAWDLSADGGLDASSVYFVEVDSGTEQVLSCYIIDGSRALPVGGMRAATTAGGPRAFPQSAKVKKNLARYVHAVNLAAAGPGPAIP